MKRGISFLDAEDVFDDPKRMERYDVEHSSDEDRWQTMGLVDDVLFVVYTERDDVTRIISARVAEPEDLYHTRGNGGYIMAIVRHTHTAGTVLSPEQQAARKARIEAAAKLPYSYDEDCPLLTPEQLSEFRRVADTTAEERKQIAIEGAQQRQRSEAVLPRR